MAKYLLLSIILGSFCCCCKKDDTIRPQTDDRGVIVATPWLWRTSWHRQKLAKNDGYIVHPVIYKDNLLVQTTNGDEKYCSLSMIDTKNGKYLWHWNDIFDIASANYVYLPSHHQYENLLAWQLGPYSYCINLDNGQTHWKILRNKSFSVYINSFGRDYFIQAPIDGNWRNNTDWAAYRCDIRTGKISEFSEISIPPDRDKYPSSFLMFGEIVPVPGQDNLLLIPYVHINVMSYIGLYDIDLQEWVWNVETITGSGLPPLIVNGRVYLYENLGMSCYDLATGRQLWKTDLSAVVYDYIIEDGILVVNCRYPYTYGLNLNTGDILWHVRTSDAQMEGLNGIVYQADSRLYAIEAATGRLVWDIDCALIEKNAPASMPHHSFKRGETAVLPAKDGLPARVIVRSQYYVYCFEAYR